MSAPGTVAGEAEDVAELGLERRGVGEHAVGPGPAPPGLVEQDGLADPGEFAEQRAHRQVQPGPVSRQPHQVGDLQGEHAGEHGFSHQDPGFIDHVMNKKAEVIRVYLPPDANTLLSVADHCLRSRDYVNVIVSGKQPSPDWLDMDSAILHAARGAGIWEWASSDGPGGEPDVVLACAGDGPTLEILAAPEVRRQHPPQLRGRVA